MDYSEVNRLSRLTAILIQLQTKNLITAAELSNKFQISKRTVYRDIRALESAGVPIITEEGKGYSLMDGYKIPPVMFTENQANALILAEQLVLRNNDASFIKDYSEAIEKVKSILRYTTKEKANILANRTQYDEVLNQKRNSNNLSDLQNALTSYRLVSIDYINQNGSFTTRIIEPFAILSTENWYVIAWCRLRNEFRFFRPDRIQKMKVLSEHFEPHNMTLQEYFDKFH
ncbi:helix-turn-helix transcriptional regulator [Zunongwangia atlantica]|uniref:Transcriptional regulator n=1 Tax=Zunongwangia atlantica 22II14-10F7 TaxID=1185767 RepID=A0A1Y1SYJ5_9FLAO|nr:YafY family protein [Zunongwangia atlantica]ORL43846.1 transcriptional regulator [Zunongwangia atlantica 22II14-10F7]